MKQQRIIKVKNVNALAKPMMPGIWHREEGGFVIRARAMDSATGRQKEIFKVLPKANAPAAMQWLDEAKKQIRECRPSVVKVKVRFSDFATSHFEHKVKVGDLKSAMSRNRWHYSLKTLIQDLGDIYLDKLHTGHIETWKVKMLERTAYAKHGGTRRLSPATINGMIALLRILMKAAKRQYQLPSDPMEGVKNIDTSEHETYTEEEPNALLPEEVGPFVARFRALYPQHFAMFFLGLMTGLRPSSLRPLRRRGLEPDVLWDQDRLLVRRSHSLGDEVMRTTKQKKRYAIDLHSDVMTVLRWHVDTQLRLPAQQESDLLFPAETGRFRTPKLLNVPLAEVARDLGLRKKITQRALRRTFNDLMRAAQVNDLVTRSISGHLTEQMQRHYSTVNSNEQREAMGKVLSLVTLTKLGVQSGGAPTDLGEQKQTG